MRNVEQDPPLDLAPDQEKSQQQTPLNEVQTRGNITPMGQAVMGLSGVRTLKVTNGFA